MLTPEGNLTTSEKKRILLNNIYGVDLDVNAVEVTKLSLLLKCLEGETEASINQQFKLFNDRVLPTLDENIKSGNSLIDIDFYDNLLDFGEEKKIKPFNWKNAFPEIFKQGGFDAVIGNPPYIRIQSIIENSETQGKYFGKKYLAAAKGNYDIYVIFIEQSLKIINSLGFVGFILPHKFFTAQYGEGIRRLLYSKKYIEEIVHFGPHQIFNNATTYTCILTLSNEKDRQDFKFYQIDDLEYWKDCGNKAELKILFSSLSETSWNFISGKEQELFNKLNQISTKLENVTDRIFQGLKTSADKIFIVRKLSEACGTFDILCPQNEKTYIVEKDLFHPIIKGGDSRGYIMGKTELLILFPYLNSILINEDDLRKNQPLTYLYLKDHQDYLKNRENGKMRTSKWFGYIYPKALDLISKPKLFTPDISPKASFSIDITGKTFFTGGVSGGYGIKVKEGVSSEYLLGLLNSKLLNWFLKNISTPMRGGWYSFESKYIKHLPIIIIDSKSKLQFEKTIEIEKLVNQLIKLNTEKNDVKLQTKIVQITNKIEYCENKINELVYELYELTEEEIKVIEAQ